MDGGPGRGDFMKGKVAVVTGGARGIGFAVAVRFLREGAHVAVLDIRDEAAEHMAVVAHKADARFFPLLADVSSYRQVREAGEKVREEFGRLDVWVNNAGWDRIAPFLSTAPSDWEKVLGINLMGTIHGTRVALEGMQAGGAGGAIVNVASDAGRVGSSGEAVYSAAPGGVIAFTKAVAREVARHGIRVNCVCPGPTDTPLLAENFQGEEGAKIIGAMQRGIPFKRLGDPGEIASAIRFLASDEASYITGQVVSVNGGLNMVG
jgi:2-hydroxycyclohexanecarboxyl-CoA dehydrogenase